MAVFGFLSISASYWNWYGFPAQYEIAEATDQIVGWFLGGLVLAAIVRPSGLDGYAEARHDPKSS
jgi:hypothetical protein